MEGKLLSQESHWIFPSDGFYDLILLKLFMLLKLNNGFIRAILEPSFSIMCMFHIKEKNGKWRQICLLLFFSCRGIPGRKCGTIVLSAEELGNCRVSFHVCVYVCVCAVLIEPIGYNWSSFWLHVTIEIEKTCIRQMVRACSLTWCTFNMASPPVS